MNTFSNGISLPTESTEANNTLSNEVIMDKSNVQANASQVEVAAQLVNGKSIVGQTSSVSTTSFVATLLTNIGDQLPKKTKYVIGYLSAKAVGFKMVFLKGNRDVYNAQLDSLWKSGKEAKKFAEDCKVVPLRPILEQFHKISVEDVEGNPVTLESPDVDKCFAVYDGQHRITVCELHPGDIDVDLELNDFDGKDPIESIKLMNSFSRNWNGTDLRVSNVGAGYSNNKLYEEAEKLQVRYGITPKLAEYILTFKRDATKKSDLVAGKDTTPYNKDNAERGLCIYNSIMMNYVGKKEMKKIEVMDAVCYVYDQTPDKEKNEFARNMKLYMGTMQEAERTEIINIMKEKNFGKLKHTLKKGYDSFRNTLPDNDVLTETEKALDARINVFVVNLETEYQQKAATKPLKHGRVSEILKHNSSLASAQEQEKLDKAKKKAELAQKKAKEAQSVVDQLENNI